MSRVAVIIPLYKSSLTATEYFSFQNTLQILNQNDIYIIGPERLKNYFQSEYHDLKIKLFPDRYFADTKGYSNLLLSKFFYKSFSNHEYILIVQTDALVLSDQINSWCNTKYSYIGAPWFKGMETPKRPLEFLGVGNGGFSLRKVDDFLKVLSKPRYFKNKLLQDAISKTGFQAMIQKTLHLIFFSYNFFPLFPSVHEDAFWGILAPDNCDFFLVPAPDEASRFAFESEPEFLYQLNHQTLPFGCHAWERYGINFWRETLKTHGFTLSDPSKSNLING